MDGIRAEDGGDGRSSRREFIRRGAVALGLGAWAVPLVQVVRSRHGGTPGVDTAPDEIGAQVIIEPCTTCALTCGELTVCGTGALFDCFCFPSADPYPIANCICAEDIFCEEAQPCGAGCPPGFACVTSCCGAPLVNLEICVPLCPEESPFAAQRQATAQGGGRLTAAGRRT